MPTIRVCSTALLLVALSAAGLVGCTASQDPDPSPSPDALEDVSVDPVELSRQILDAASTADGELPVLGSQTLQIESRDDGPIEATVEVHVVERRADSTLLTLSMSSPVEGAFLDPSVFDEGTSNAFFDRIALEDATGGIRYYGLSWRREVNSELSPPAEYPLNSCVCAYRQNITLGSEAIFMDALYSPLPAELESVALTASGGLSIPDLPVGDASDERDESG